MRTRGEGGLEKIGDIWYFTFYNLNGKQVRRSSKSPLKSVAIEMLQKAQEELRKGTQPTVTRKLYYEDLRQILLDDYKDKGKLVMDGDDPVITGRRGHLKALDDHFKGMSVVVITEHTLRRFKTERMENGVAGPTCNRSLAYLRRMFKLAQRQGKVVNVPYFPMERESEPREGFLERSDFERLRAAMPEHLHPALTFCYETGCRTGAMEKIIWPWVNLARQEVSLPPGIVKNRKPLTLPLSVELVGMLKKKFQTNGSVFAMQNFRREWFKACVKIGVGEKAGPEWYQYKGLTPHDFRRSAVRNLINAGVDQATAMKISGHRTLSVFLRYDIVSTEQLHAAMAKVSNNATTTQSAVGNSRK
jgi:integrase